MAKKIFTDRSRILRYQRCPRARYLEYHFGGQGIVSARQPLPLAVGSAVHAGLEVLLRRGQEWLYLDLFDSNLRLIEDEAVETAVNELGIHRGSLELDTAEQVAQAASLPAAAGSQEELNAQLAASLGMTVEEAGLSVQPVDPSAKAKEWDDWLWQEQSALVEGLVRAYARRRLRPLLAEFEVLEVEREGQWLLAEDLGAEDFTRIPVGGRIHDESFQLWFMSRPDALLRSRSDNSLYLLSYKTAAAWDVRKARDAERDMQGLSEGVEVERRLGEWWQGLHYDDADAPHPEFPYDKVSKAMTDYLAALPAPPRILGIRYEYLLKGERWKDKDLSARFGFEARSQKSPLVRQYVCTSVPQRGASAGAYSHGDVCWAWDYIKEDGSDGKLAWQNWSSQPVSDVRAWIDLLDAATETMSQYDSTVGIEPRALGWGGPAQRMGYTKQHPLDSVFVAPITIYRQQDDLLDMVEQMEAQERTVAESVALVAGAADEGERRSLLNRHFVQNRQSCSYPSECAYVKVCYGGEDIRLAPTSSGLFKIRVPNHPQEAEGGK